VELLAAVRWAGVGAEVAFLPVVFAGVVEAGFAEDADFVAAFFAGAAFVDPVGALAVVFLAGAVVFTAPFALLVVLGVMVRFVAEVFAVLGADLAALLVRPAVALLALGPRALALPALGRATLPVPGLAAVFVTVRDAEALVLEVLAPVAALAAGVFVAPLLAGLDFGLPSPLDAARLALVLVVVSFLVAVAALATLRLRRGCAASAESVARTLVVIPSPSKRFRGTGCAATLPADRVVLAAAAAPRYRPGDPAGAASWRRAARSS
jgi:hypothetical protein